MLAYSSSSVCGDCVLSPARVASGDAVSEWETLDIDTDTDKSAEVSASVIASDMDDVDEKAPGDVGASFSKTKRPMSAMSGKTCRSTRVASGVGCTTGDGATAGGELAKVTPLFDRAERPLRWATLPVRGERTFLPRNSGR